MSWQQYVDQNLMCSVDSDGHTLSSAALVGFDGSIWAQSPAFPALTPAETTTILAILADPFNHSGSFTIGGVKHMVIQSDDPETKLRGKCAGGGSSISKTGKTLVVGIWAEPVIHAACNKVVEHLAEYLLSVDY